MIFLSGILDVKIFHLSDIRLVMHGFVDLLININKCYRQGKMRERHPPRFCLSKKRTEYETAQLWRTSVDWSLWQIHISSGSFVARGETA